MALNDQKTPQKGFINHTREEMEMLSSFQKHITPFDYAPELTERCENEMPGRFHEIPNLFNVNSSKLAKEP